MNTPFAVAAIAWPVTAFWDDPTCAPGVLPLENSGRGSTDTQRGGRFAMAGRALSGKSTPYGCRCPQGRPSISCLSRDHHLPTGFAQAGPCTM